MRYPKPQLYKPRNPKKYMGNPNNIIARSGLELKYFKYIDMHKEIVKWASEEFHIPYYCPVRKNQHRYFPDVFLITANDKKVLIEIKPASQTIEPTRTGKKSKKTMLNEAIDWEINCAKWGAAEKYCLERGWTFLKATEKEIKNLWGKE